MADLVLIVLGNFRRSLQQIIARYIIEKLNEINIVELFCA